MSIQRALPTHLSEPVASRRPSSIRLLIDHPVAGIGRHRAWLSKLVLALAMVLAAPTLVWADAISNGFLSPTEFRTFRRESARLGPELFAAQSGSPAPATTSWSLTAGAAYDRAEDGSHTWTTPFDLSASLPDGQTFLDLTGDGYTDQQGGTSAAHGLADITLSASHAFTLSPATSLHLGAALTFPTHGEVGSTSFSQRISVGAAQGFDQWVVTLVGKVSRSDEAADGVSRFAKAVLGQVTYKVPHQEGVDVVAQLVRGTRSGAGGSTSAALGADFPLFKKVGGTFTLVRGISSGARDTSAEVDISFPF